MLSRTSLVLFLVLAALATSVSAQCLTTLYARNNGGSNGGAIYFDVDVINPAGLTVTVIDTNTAETVPLQLDVYTISGSHVGNETTGAWTLVSSGTATGAGQNNPTSIDVTDFMLPVGQTGIALVMNSAAGHDYTNGNGSNQVYSNADLTITCGSATNVPFSGNPFTPRVWNGTLYYTTPGGSPCATVGSFGAGCGTQPLTLTASARPSFGTTFTADTSNISATTNFGVVLLGLIEINPPFDLAAIGAPGCFQYITNDVTLVWFPAGTTASNPVSIPANPGLSGVQFYGQSVAFDAAANTFGLLSSNALHFVVGS